MEKDFCTPFFGTREQRAESRRHRLTTSWKLHAPQRRADVEVSYTSRTYLRRMDTSETRVEAFDRNMAISLRRAYCNCSITRGGQSGDFELPQQEMASVTIFRRALQPVAADDRQPRAEFRREAGPGNAVPPALPCRDQRTLRACPRLWLMQTLAALGSCGSFHAGAVASTVAPAS